MTIIEIILIGIFILLLGILYFLNKPTHLKAQQSSTSVGGLVGRMEGGTIRDSHSKVKIRMRGSPEKANVGGLVGSMSKGSLVEGSTSDANIEFYEETIDDVLYNKPLKLWVLGGFFVVILFVILVTIYYLQTLINPWRLILVGILSISIYIVVTAIILKFFSKIRDETFLKLISIAATKLPKSLKIFFKNIQKYISEK